MLAEKSISVTRNPTKMIKAICLPSNVDEKPNFSICFTTIINYVTHDYVTYEYVTYE